MINMAIKGVVSAYGGTSTGDAMGMDIPERESTNRHKRCL